MRNYELLNAQKHSQLHIFPANKNEPHFVQVVASEFSTAAVSSPIMFSKEPATGKFFAGVVLSLKPGEPPLKTVAERCDFTPLALQCNGFYISNDHIAIDPDNPRFSKTEGEPLFSESQQAHDSLRRIQNALGKFHSGVEATDAFIRSMLELKIIEPIDMSLSFDSGERLSLRGLYTISRTALHDIDEATAIRFFRLGYLELAYTVATSLNQFGVLAQLRNQRLLSSA